MLERDLKVENNSLLTRPILKSVRVRKKTLHSSNPGKVKILLFYFDLIFAMLGSRDIYNFMLEQVHGIYDCRFASNVKPS